MIDGCTSKNQNTFRTPENELTCASYFRILKRVNARSVRFKSTNFTENKAMAGGAIFTNNFTMIRILPDLQGDPNPDVDSSLGYALTENASQFTASGVSFDRNVAVDKGYGDRAASTPFVAFLHELDDEENDKRRSSITKSFFLSGDHLQFDVRFTDGIGQNVTFADILTAHISCDEDRTRRETSGCAQLEITGQEVALVNEDGTLSFTDVRLRGLKDKTYVLRVDYNATPELQTLNVKPSYIYVSIRPCMVGETAVIKDDRYLMCQECSSSTYNIKPEEAECRPCPEHGNCESKVITPDNGYWQKTPCSDRLYRCLPTSACDFDERSEGLEKLTQDLTSCNFSQEWRTNYTRDQCAKVLPAILLFLQMQDG